MELTIETLNTAATSLQHAKNAHTALGKRVTGEVLTPLVELNVARTLGDSMALLQTADRALNVAGENFNKGNQIVDAVLAASRGDVSKIMALGVTTQQQAQDMQQQALALGQRALNSTMQSIRTAQNLGAIVLRVLEAPTLPEDIASRLQTLEERLKQAEDTIVDLRGQIQGAQKAVAATAASVTPVLMPSTPVQPTPPRRGRPPKKP